MQILCLAFVTAAAWILGGSWEWALLAALGLGVAKWQDSTRTAFTMSAIAVTLAAAFWFTGDRRLFFPYSMQFAALALFGESAAIAAAAALGGVFFWIRISQQASREVLLFELLSAIAILGFAAVFRANGAGRVTVGVLTAAFAILSLAL